MAPSCQPKSEEIDWHKESKRILRSELVRKGISITELSKRLEAISVFESPKSLAVKISRGKFQLAFFLQCMTALDSDSVAITMPFLKVKG